jgi:hypothetical protein
MGPSFFMPERKIAGAYLFSVIFIFFISFFDIIVLCDYFAREGVVLWDLI